MKTSSTYCVHLFSQVYIDNLGFYAPCCHFRNKMIVDRNNLQHVTEISPTQYLNSEEMQEFRTQCNENIEIPECQHCFQLEKSGSQSMRLQDNKFFEHRKLRSGSRAKNKELLSLDFRAGNLCNLGCISCAPSASSKLDSLWTQYGAENFAKDGCTMKEYNLRVNVTDWYKDPTLFESISRECENIEQLTLVGGEPLASSENLKLLKALRYRGKSLQLEVSSNGSLINSEVLDLLESFQTYFKFSMDGVYEVCEYIRYPADFDVLEKNLNQLLSRDIEAGLIVTVSVLNLMNIKDQYLWARKKADHHQRKLYFYMANFVHQPDHLCAAHLPRELKLRAIDQLLWIKNDLESNPSDFLITLGSESSLINFLENSNEAPEKIQAGWKFVEYYDKVRGNSWRSVAPYLKQLIDAKN